MLLSLKTVADIEGPDVVLGGEHDGVPDRVADGVSLDVTSQDVPFEMMMQGGVSGRVLGGVQGGDLGGEPVAGLRVKHCCKGRAAGWTFWHELFSKSADFCSSTFSGLMGRNWKFFCWLLFGILIF